MVLAFPVADDANGNGWGIPKDLAKPDQYSKSAADHGDAREANSRFAGRRQIEWGSDAVRFRVVASQVA
jgi:hypothetical protein